MKNRLVVALLFVGLTSSLAFGVTKGATVHVNGMVCAFCSQGITKKFKAQDAIESVHVDMDKKEVHLMFKEGKDIDDAQITELIKDSGVNVQKIDR
jgi:mercuric ion binding protein